MLKIARGLQLDADYYGGGTFALLGKKGAGKSFAQRVLAEELWREHVPFVAFDPMGVGWGLRSSADGSKEGIGVPIFGGPHGDAPLERGGGQVLADLVIEEGLSMVLDMSELGSHAAEREFALAFLERLYRKNKRLVHLLMDEADMFAPQGRHAGDERLLGVMENIVRRGRNRGIGITMLTQRPAVLHKDVLTQVDGLALLRITSPQDRAAADDWMKGHASAAQGAEVRRSLAGLGNGESWWWVPELDILKRVQIRMSRTFDSSPTRTRSDRREPPKTIADVDLGAITEKMEAAIERKKAEDPAELRARIRELEQGLAIERAKQPPPGPTEIEVVREVPTVPEGFSDKVESIAERLSKVNTLADELRSAAFGVECEAAAGLEDIDGLREGLVSVREDAERPPKAITGPLATPLPDGWPESRLAPPRGSGVEEHFDTALPTPRRPQVGPEESFPRKMEHDRRQSTNGKVTLGKAERAILTVLSRYGTRSTRQLALQTGYSAKGGGFRNALGKLRNSEPPLIVGSGDAIEITGDGAAHAHTAEPLPRGQDLLGHWVSQVAKAEGLILSALAIHGPLSVEELASLTGYEPSGGGFRNALGKLRTLELISKGKPIALTDEFAAAISG